MYLNNKTFDVLKWVAQFLLPGLASLYFALSGIWGFPYPEQVVGTIIAIDVFLGIVLGLSNMQYQAVQSLHSGAYTEYAEMLYDNKEARINTSVLDISTGIYDVLKLVALIVLPAVGTLYFTLSQLWGFPYGEQIVGSIAIITSVLGALLGVSTYKFNKATDNNPFTSPE